MVLGKPCYVKQWPNQSSYTSNHLIAKRDEYPCHAKQWPTPTSFGLLNSHIVMTDSLNKSFDLQLFIGELFLFRNT